ncbi:MAG: xanthine dehydrogenase family protein subunit M [Thaumarchaeota archaeon]|nr:xanthine dehydrogenase family protein subunit M [Nitrososphaerota archaeon]
MPHDGGSCLGGLQLIPRPFEYHAPKTVREAVALLKQHRGEAKVLAGGQSLIPLMKLRILSPAHLVSLNGVKGLEYIRKEKGAVSIGALTRMADIESSELLRKECPILTECAAQIADPLVRNLGTIGGNVSHADPTNDMPAVMVAWGADMVVVGPRGRRKVPASDFFRDTFTTAMAEDEILTELSLPLVRRMGGAYLKLERQAGDYGIVGVAAGLWIGDDGRCVGCGIGLTGVGPTAIKARRAEEALVGTKAGRVAIEEAAKRAAEDSKPTSDLRGSEEYKRDMVRVFAKRALSLALKRARSRSR